MKNLIYFIAIFIFAFTGLKSQEAIRIIDYDYSAYPRISNKLFVFESNGNPAFNLNAGNFRITDNGNIQNNILSFNCPQNNIVESNSYTLVFDLGLDNHYHYPTNFNLGKQVANRLINLIDTTKSEISLISYDYRTFLNREFTNVKTVLLAEVAKFAPAAGSLFDAAFLSEPAEAFKIISRAKNDSKSIILITDGGGKYDFTQISGKLAQSGVKLFVISLRKSPHQSLRELSINSDGWWFDLSESGKLNSVVYSVIAMSKGYIPCDLNWNMDYTCDDIHNIDILARTQNVRDNFSFNFNSFEKSYILSDTAYLPFSSVNVGSKKSIPVTLTAKNRDILISEIRIQSPFSISSGNVSNHLLRRDESIDLVVEYTPVREAIVFSQLEIISDACEPKSIYMTGGFPNTAPAEGEETVRMLKPNGGEYLIIGDTTEIHWLGLLPTDMVQLSYTIDNGRSWQPLATNVTGLTKEWIVPNKPSDSCRVMVMQMWPNNAGETMDLKHRGNVNTAFFNNEGDLVLTSSNDTTAAVWVANTGFKKFNLIGHNKPVHWAVFDPQNKYIATCSSDSLVIIWSIDDGSIVKIIDEHKTRVESVNFSSSGEYFVSSDFRGFAIIRDREWNILKTVRANPFGVSKYVEFHPLNDDLILSANLDGTIKEWNWRNYNGSTTPLKNFKAQMDLNKCTHATYNTDGTKVAATTESGDPKVLFVWDHDNDTEPIYEITHNANDEENFAINFSSFFFHPTFNKEVILTSSNDQTARLWDAADGSPLQYKVFSDNIFREHLNSVATAKFDRFGTRLLTASWDSTAKIWNITKDTLQIDVSDSLFSIAFAKGKGLDIDMGTVFAGELKDSIIRAVFINESEFAYNVLGYKFSGVNADDFEILTDLKLPMKIGANDSIPLEIRFYPKSGDAELRVAELEFYLPASGVVKSQIRGRSEAADIKLDYTLLDFGGVEVGSFKDISLPFVMTNDSGRALEIDSITVIGSYKTEFNSMQNVGSTLPANGNIPVTFRFLPENIGRKNAQYAVHFKGKGSPRLVNLFGEGIDSRNDSIRFYINDISAFPGDVFKLPIYVGDVSSNGISENITGFTTELKFNKTLLEPLSGFSNSEITGDMRKLTIDLPTTFSGDSVIHSLEFKALWGNDTISPLNLEFTVPKGNSRIAIKENSATFKLNGVCLQDGVLRLFLPGELSLSQNLPNPASERTSVTFNVLENGNTKIVIYDILGNEVRTLVNSHLPVGEHKIDFDVSGLSPGIYYYSMITPSNILRKTMLITR